MDLVKLKETGDMTGDVLNVTSHLSLFEAV